MLSTQRAIDLMGEGGRIVTISGIDRTVTMPGHAPLGAARAALEQLPRYVAVEHGDNGIRANAVNVGVSRTESSEYFLDSTDAARAWGDLMTEKTPRGVVTPPESIGSAVAMLCSDDSGDVSGQVRYVDSGITARF